MKHCKNCDLKYPDNKKFCENCGKNLSKLVIKPLKSESGKIKESGKINKKLIFVGVPVAIFIIFLAYFSTTSRPYIESATSPIQGSFIETVEETSATSPESSSSSSGQPFGIPTATKKCYYVDEPYTVQVPYTYTVQVPYPYDYKYLAENWKCEHLFDFNRGEYVQASLDVSNVENNGGAFSVNFNFRTLEGTIVERVTYYIQPHSTVTFSKIFDNTVGQDVECTYDVTTATETRYNEESRIGYRDEIQYKTIQKCE